MVDIKIEEISKYKTIRLQKETVKSLLNYNREGYSWNDICQRVLQENEKLKQKIELLEQEKKELEKELEEKED